MYETWCLIRVSNQYIFKLSINKCSLGAYYILGTRLGTRIKSHFTLPQKNIELALTKYKVTDVSLKTQWIYFMQEENTYFNAFSNLVSVSNRANKLSPVGKLKYLEQNSDQGGTIKQQAIK